MAKTEVIEKKKDGKKSAEVEVEIDQPTDETVAKEVVADETATEGSGVLKEVGEESSQPLVEELPIDEAPVEEDTDDDLFTQVEEPTAPKLVAPVSEPINVPPVEMTENTRYIPVVDSFVTGTIVGFIETENVPKFAENTRGGLMEDGSFGVVVCTEKGIVIGRLGTIRIGNDMVPAVDCITVAQQVAVNEYKKYERCADGIFGHKFSRLMTLSDFIIA